MKSFFQPAARRIAAAGATLSLLTADGPLQAQTNLGPASTDPMALTPAFLNQLAERMQTNHPGLRAAQHRARAARADSRAVPTWMDPMLMVGGMGAEEEMRADEGDILYGFEQPLPLFGKPRRERQVREAEADRADREADFAFQSQRRDLAQSLFQAALTQREASLAQEDLRWLATLLATAEQRYRVGDTTAVNLLRLQNERAERQTQVTNNQDRIQRDFARVNRLLNQPLDTPWPTLTLPPVADPIPFSPRLTELALRFEPRLRVLREELRRDEAAVERSRRQRYPDLSLGVEARSYSGDGDFRQAMVTLKFNLPWANTSRYRSAIAADLDRLHAAENETANYELAVQEEIRRLTLDLAAARREALLYRDEILPRSAQALATAEAAWRNGPGLFIDVMDARRQLLAAHRAAAQTVATQYLFLVDLALCCGLADLDALDMIRTETSPSSLPKP